MGRLRAIAVGLVGGIVLATGLTYALSARAITCCDPWGVPGKLAFISAGNTVTAAITAATANIGTQMQWIQDTLSNGFGKTYAEQAKQTSAKRTIEEGAIQARTALFLAGVEGQAMVEVPRREDFDQTIVNSAFLAEQAAIEQRHRLDLGTAVSQRVLNSPYANPALARFNQHGHWCTPVGKQMGLCNEPVELGLGNADAQFATLVDKDAGLTYSDARRQAAVDFVSTILSSDLRAQQNNDTAQAHVADGMTLADQAMLSLAAASFLDMAAERTRRNQPPLPPAKTGD